MILCYLVVTIFCISFCFLEKRMYKTWFTPLNLFSIPLLTVLGILILFSTFYKIPQVGLEIIFWYGIYITSFGVIGLVFYSVIQKYITNYRGVNHKLYLNKSISSIEYLDKIFMFLGITAGIYLILNFIYLAKGVPNLQAITYSTFQNQYAGGINFYLRIICMIVITYFIGTITKQEKFKFLVVIIAYIPLVLGLVKGIVMLPLIAGFVFRYVISQNRFKLKNTILIIISCLIIFIGVYMIEDSLGSNENILSIDFYLSKLEKFVIYLISGTQSFNINLSNNFIFKNYGVPNPTFAPFNNMFAKILDLARIDSVPSVRTFIGNFKYTGIAETNTNTYIGTLILYNGYYISFITHVIWVTISYLLFYRAIFSKKIIHYLTFSLFSFTLIMSWFDYWYLHSYWYYMWIIIELINLSTKFKQHNKSDIKKKIDSADMVNQRMNSGNNYVYIKSNKP
ncbi:MULTISPECIES: DUF6337 family protein [unclassified Paenibacillus]|uniref:DUF6337 family protein n=1 Tax=unclassified Paenibacillus TaxID=185978 RepID=UPI0019165FF7|nr:DUF6337 family protein [Paenibacillus sp. EPM92]